MLSGHFHKLIYTEAGEKEPEFPIIINSDKDLLDIDVNPDRITVNIRDTSGKTIRTYAYPAKR